MSKELIHFSRFGNVFHCPLVLTAASKQFAEGHVYTIEVPRQHDGSYTTLLEFQNGPLQEFGVNGITNEQLLEILLHRMAILNKAFPCRENSLAITNMEQSLMWLERRTNRRMAAGVEGKSLPAPGDPAGRYSSGGA